MRVSVTLLSVCLTACALNTTTVEAANCALRNPDRQIYDIFPGATNYKSVVKNVDSRIRPDVEKRLGSRLDFGDLGKHTICIVFRDGVPIGIVHARSEVGTYGSVELVWALDLDMRIKDFRVQRSREKHTDAIRSQVFRDSLIGKDARQLRSFLTDSNKVVDAAALQVPADAAHIARLAVISGAKTLLITAAAFGDSIHRARLLGHIHEAFPQTSKVTKIKEPFNSDTMAIIEGRGGSSSNLIDRGSFQALRSVDQNGATLGALAYSRPLGSSTGTEYWWTVTAEGRILNVWITGTADDAAQAGLSELMGKNLAGVAQLFETSSEPSRRHALEVLAVFAAAGIGE